MAATVAPAPHRDVITVQDIADHYTLRTQHKDARQNRLTMPVPRCRASIICREAVSTHLCGDAVPEDLCKRANEWFTAGLEGG